MYNTVFIITETQTKARSKSPVQRLAQIRNRIKEKILEITMLCYYIEHAKVLVKFSVTWSSLVPNRK